MRILIGYDGSVPAEGALKDLAKAGLPAKAEAVVLSVATAWGTDPAPGQTRKQAWPGSMIGKRYHRHLDQTMKETRDLADQGKRRLREHHAAWEVKAEAAIDDAAEALLRKAGSWKADLIVVGSGRSAISRLFLGSVSQKILNYARTSVRITRPGPKGKPGPPRILIGLDGSDNSLAAVAAVGARSWPEKTAVRLVAVIDTRSLLSVLPARTAPRKWKVVTPIGDWGWLEGKMESAMDQLAAAGMDVEPIILKGDPRRVLLEQAKDWHAQTLFLGSRGLNRVERFIIGGISSTVAMQAPCSVEIIKMKRKRRE
jgi:nucleotide-binding universal stress UspA family protein